VTNPTPKARTTKPRGTSARSGRRSQPSSGRVVDSGVVIGDDGLARPQWAAVDVLLRDYYDTEWGVPVRDEQGLFERISLEAFQAGLSWATILRKRPAFRAAFHGFDPDVVARYSANDVDRLLADDGIVRNRHKINATITNARATLTLRDDGGLANLIWSFRPAETPALRTFADIPTRSPESEALSNELWRRGFAFVGPTTMFARMEAVGIIDTHLVDSHRRGASGVWTASRQPGRGPGPTARPTRRPWRRERPTNRGVPPGRSSSGSSPWPDARPVIER
jgi:DNA-3-methyladenine glycosylase I